MRHGLRVLGWLGLFAVVAGCFFWKVLFLQFSLVPADLLHHLIPPFNSAVSQVAVQNHYAIDEITQLYPGGLFWQQSALSGELPLWNPYLYGGHPHFGNGMWGVLSPFKLLYLFLPAERAYSLGLVLAFWLAGVFMFGFLRELGRSRAAAFLGGCAYQMSSSIVLFHWLFLNVFAWLPLVLLLFERAQRRKSWGHALAAGMVLGVAFISGSIQMAFYAGVLCSAWFALAVPWRDPLLRRKFLARAGLVLLVGALVAAVQWLPTLEFLAREATGRIHNTDANRAGLRHTLLGIPFLVTFLFPALAGSPETFDVLKAVNASLGEFTGYIGLVPFTLAVVGMSGAKERRIRGLWLIIAGVLVTVFFTPLLKYVYHRFFILVVFALVVFAAHGFDLVMEGADENVRRARRAFAGLLALGLLVVIGLVAGQIIVGVKREALVAAGQRYVTGRTESVARASQRQWLLERVPRFLDHYRMSNPMFWVPLATLCGAAFCWRCYGRRKIGPTVFSTALIGLTVCDLTVLGRAWVPQVDVRQYPLYPPHELLARVQADPDLFRVHHYDPNHLFLLPNNVLMVYGLSALAGYDSLVAENLNSLKNQTGGQFNTVLDLQNVKYLFTDPSVDLPADRFELLLESDGVRLFRNRNCLPRMLFVPRAQVVADRTTIPALLVSPEFDPRQLVLLEREPPPAGDSASATPAVVEVKHYSPQRVLARVNSARAGFVVLADSYYPGWRARVDQQPTPIYRANGVMRAVVVPAGGHEVEFFFAPVSFRMGLAISGGTVIFGSLAVLIGAWRHNRRVMPAAV